MIVNPEPIEAEDIGRYYDDFHSLYELVWGHHLHHGYWDDRTRSTQQAITNLLDLVADWLRVGPADRLADIGCGYGASGIYLNQRFKCHIEGFTVSEKQFQLGKQLTNSDRVSMHLEDWMSSRLPTHPYDGIFSLECLCHISHKSQFFQKISDSLNPGARAVLTFLAASPQGAQWYRLPLLQPICRPARFPSLPELDDVDHWITQAGLKSIVSKNITPHIMPTWPAIFSQALKRSPKAWLKGDSRLSLGRAEIGLTLNALRLLTAFSVRALQYRILVLEKSRSRGY